MKSFYFIFFILCTAFFILLHYSPKWSLAAVGVTMLFSAYHFYLARLKGAESRSRAFQQQVDELHVQLDSSILKEQRTHKEAEKAINIKQELLASINHGIRTPMNGMLGMTYLLINTPLNNEQLEYIDTIKYCGESLMATVNSILVSDLLNFSKLEWDGEELEKRDFELRNCVKEVLMMFADRVGEEGPALAYCMDVNVPEQVNGDRKMFCKVLMNLVENAVRHTKKGEIFLGIRNLASPIDSKIDLAFEIRDTGSGIPENKMRHLFTGIISEEPLATTEKVPAGLGLILCKKLIELMGGRINVESKLGQGTTFTFNIFFSPSLKPKYSPLHPGSPEAGKKITLAVPGGKGGKEKRVLSEEFAKEYPLRILVGEDNVVNQKLTMKVLEKLGYRADLAMNGKEVLEMADLEQYDLILMDVQMPEMDGLEATRMLRLCLEKQPVIIAMTANVMEGDKDDCTQAGMDDYISKPVELNELLTKLEKWGGAIKARRLTSI